MNVTYSASVSPPDRRRARRAILLVGEVGLLVVAGRMLFADGSDELEVYALLLATCVLEGLYIPLIRDPKLRSASVLGTFTVALLALLGAVLYFRR
jgi:hypothetical protein